MLEENRARSKGWDLWPSCFLCTECPVTTVELVLIFQVPHQMIISVKSSQFTADSVMASLWGWGQPLSYSSLHFPNHHPPPRKAPWIFCRGKMTLSPQVTTGCASLRVADPRVGWEREKRKGADIQGPKEQASKQMTQWGIHTVCVLEAGMKANRRDQQWLGMCLLQGKQVPSLLRELRFHVPWGS